MKTLALLFAFISASCIYAQESVLDKIFVSEGGDVVAEESIVSNKPEPNLRQMSDKLVWLRGNKIIQVEKGWANFSEIASDDDLMKLFQDELEDEAQRRAHIRTLYTVRTPRFDNAAAYGRFFEVYYDLVFDILMASIIHKTDRKRFESDYEKIYEHYSIRLDALKEEYGIAYSQAASMEKLKI